VCMGRTNEGKWGWLAITAVVVIWDAWAIKYKHQTLSAYFRGLSRTPVGRVGLIVLWGGLTAHLFSEKIDPVRLVDLILRNPQAVSRLGRQLTNDLSVVAK